MNLMTGSRREPMGVSSGYESFFRTHFVGVAKAAALIAGDPGSGQELAQEAFLRLYQRWGSMTSDDHARNFVFKVAINLARSHVRKHLRLVPWSADHDQRLPAGDQHTAEASREVIAALTALSHRQRACVVLVDLIDMDSISAARALGINANTVRVHLMRGRQALRAALGVPPTESEDDER